MKAVVTRIFQDKFTKEVHEVGTTVDYEPKRAMDLEERGLIRVVEEKAEPSKSTTEGKKKNDRIGKSGRK